MSEVVENKNHSYKEEGIYLGHMLNKISDDISLLQTNMTKVGEGLKTCGHENELIYFIKRLKTSNVDLKCTLGAINFFLGFTLLKLEKVTTATAENVVK